jgi:hypothetical protein
MLVNSYFGEFAPTTIVYVRSINSFMHVAHDKNILCDSYIVNFIHDATEGYYERARIPRRCQRRPWLM